ncbi:uncharacterized protein LOC141588555 [Silene latifolia]|uniref:uncharacterized protein LOC141588555 n=1 Tax=Silene latifolia TaxID=37657 RepID=UPI003D78198C
MEADCRKYVRHCHNCQIFANVQHVPPSMLYTMTSPWPFSTWGIDIIGKKYKIKHHKSSPYRPQKNGAVEASNKTVATILRKMIDNYREWPEKIPFVLWGYRTSIRTATGATPYYLVYEMEAVQPVELEIPSLRILLESEVPEADWVQARYNSLVTLDERRLNALYHVQLYQKRIEMAFNKKVKP